MGLLRNLWRKYTHSKALDELSGKLETDFFESVYRITYLAGLSTSDRSTSYLLYKYFVRFLIFSLMGGEIWFLCTDGSNLDEGAKCFSVIMIQFITQYRYRNVISNKHLYSNLAKSMNSPYFDISTETRRKLVETWARKSDTYLKLVVFLGNASLWSWFIDPLFDDISYNLVTDTRLPFDYRTPKMYPVGYFLVMISLWYVGQNVMVTDSTMQAHLIHILCQFVVLADCFENVLSECIVGFEGISTDDLIYNKQFVEKITKRLGNLVEQHKLILSYTRNLDTVLSRPMLAQLGCSGLMICFLGYQAVSAIDQGIAKFLGIVVYLSYNLFQIYIICRWCEEITNWSANIGKSIYFSGWESVGKIPGVGSTLMIVIARTNHPVYLTAGGMYYLSIESFGRLVKGSYSFLMVLLRFRS